MKKTRGDKTKKRQTKNKKIKGGSISKSTTMKSPNAISKNEKKKLKMLAIIYADVINELVFCTYDAFYKIENAKLTEEERNFYKTFINCAVNNVFKRLYEIGMIGEKDIENLIETMRMYINTKYVGGAKSFGNNTQMIIFSIIAILFLANQLASIYELNKHSVVPNELNKHSVVPNKLNTLPVVPNKSSKKLSRRNSNFNKTEYQIELFSGTNAFLKEIKNNNELRKYLTNVFGSCYTISYFYQLSLTHASEELKERKLKQFAAYFNGMFVENPPEFGHLPYPFSKILFHHLDKGNNLGVKISMNLKSQNPLIKHMGVVPVPPSDNQIEYINELLINQFDESKMHMGGNSTLTTVMTEYHVFLLMSYYYLGENNEINVANCVFNPNMIIPYVNINNPIQFPVICDRNFPFPHEMFPEANVVVVHSILNSKNPVIAIETQNYGNNLNPQPNIGESLKYMRRVMQQIMNGFKIQQQLFEEFAKNAKNNNDEKMFIFINEELGNFNKALGLYYLNPDYDAKKTEINTLIKPNDDELSNLLSNFSPNDLKRWKNAYQTGKFDLKKIF